MPPATEPVLDPAAPYRSAQDVVAAVGHGDWSRFRWILDQVDPYERVGLILRAARSGGGPMAERQLAAHPDDAAAGAVLGSALTVHAWEIRTGLRPEHVSADQFALFHQGLQHADLVITEALLHHPDDPALWTVSLPAARGLQLGLSEAEHRYHQVARLLPGLRPAQAHHLQYLCPKWFGSWEQADTFAEGCARESPPGSFAAVAVAELAIEHVVDVRVRSATDYLKVLPGTPWPQRIRQAADWSIGHPGFQRRFGWVEVLNTFALAFALAGEAGSARGILARCDPYGTESPWTMFGDPATLIDRVRSGRPMLRRR